MTNKNYYHKLCQMQAIYITKWFSINLRKSKF